jgi:hypothetical protein
VFGMASFLGIPVVTQEEIDELERKGEIVVYRMIRVADAHPTAGSSALRARRFQVTCENKHCRELCWFDPASFEPVKHLKVIRLCGQCTLNRAREEAAADGRD